MKRRSDSCGASTTRSVKHCARNGCRVRSIHSIIDRASAGSSETEEPDLYKMEYEGASNEGAHCFARVLGRVRPRRVLELACGWGRVTFTPASALSKAEIVGVDSSIEMLGKAAAAHVAAESSVRERVS